MFHAPDGVTYKAQMKTLNSLCPGFVQKHPEIRVKSTQIITVRLFLAGVNAVKVFQVLLLCDCVCSSASFPV